MNSLPTPVLLIAWRRPHTLKLLIDVLRPLSPSLVFVACDGPNPLRQGEAEKVASTRALIDKEIDWPCEIHRLYSDTNLGCSVGPIKAITWFFKHVEEGIILEDDCVPHPDFFSYCQALLERYRHDTRIWCISGDNFQNGQWRGNGSYYFSHYNHCWGWASWRRCWQYYDPSIGKWPILNKSGLMETIFEDRVERNYWSRIWQRTHNHPESVTWWDYQWTFTCLSNGGLTALPNRNLVSNIGIGCDASHTNQDIQVTVSAEALGTLIHPLLILRDKAADSFTFDTHFGGIALKRRARVPPVLMKIARLLRDYFKEANV